MYSELRNERTEWEAEWRDISDYLLPGRGIYQTYSKPRKRKLTSTNVINSVAEDALYVLTSGMHGGLTSPSRPWFDLEWENLDLVGFEPLQAWLQDCSKRLHTELQRSNFYSIINSFYTEYVGFGNGSVYVGGDTYSDDIAFRFELLTAGEYAFSVGADGKPSVFMRTIFKTPRQIYEEFPNAASDYVYGLVSTNAPTADKTYITIVEAVMKVNDLDIASPGSVGAPYLRVVYEMNETGLDRTQGDTAPLEVSGYHEFPYPVARWNTIGSDVYGIGPGSRALPDIKRLQEMEKALLMATHKTINPPLNIHSRLRGKVNTLPGGKTYSKDPGESIHELYQVRFDYTGVSNSIERVENRIQRNFFNDIFLTGSRDPNATPYKAAEVYARDQEKMLRLGPVIERLQSEFYEPLIERCFNIMLRKEKFQPLPPDLAKMAGNFKISLVSPLATAQRSVALQGINSFMAFLGQAAQFNQEILDNVDPDFAAREYANITGVDLGVLRPAEVVQQIRVQRAQQMAQERARQQQMEEAQLGSELKLEAAQAQKTQAEAGQLMIEGQQSAIESGLM
jgi:hypothetical protein